MSDPQMVDIIRLIKASLHCYGEGSMVYVRKSVYAELFGQEAIEPQGSPRSDSIVVPFSKIKTAVMEYRFPEDTDGADGQAGASPSGEVGGGPASDEGRQDPREGGDKPPTG